MKNLLSKLCVLSLIGVLANVATAERPFGSRIVRQDMQTRGDVWAQNHASSRPWHGQHYYTQYGQPTALVVPPTGVLQQTYSWGVSRNYMRPNYHQFGYQGQPSMGGAFYATPVWPSSTQQFGVYPVRAPW